MVRDVGTLGSAVICYLQRWIENRRGRRLFTPLGAGNVPSGLTLGQGLPLHTSAGWKAVFLAGCGLFPSEINLKSCVAALTQFSRYYLPVLLAGSGLTSFNSVSLEKDM